MWSAVCQSVKKTLDLFLPPICLNCSKNLDHSNGLYFCRECTDSIEPLPVGHCRCCAHPFASAESVHLCGNCLKNPPSFSKVYAACRYRGSIKTAIQSLKYRNQLVLAAPLSILLSKVIGEAKDDFRPDCIIPVPLHRKRLRQRTYNQAVELSRTGSRRHGLPLDVSTLQRSRWTEPQKGLSADERRKNLRDAFMVSAPVPGKKILLVDDVITTGETIRACSKVLISAGAEEVRAAAVGRA